MYELIYTSVAKGVHGGSGYTTAAHTQDMPRTLIDSAEAISTFQHTEANPLAFDKNPVGFSHLTIGSGSQRAHLVSRIAACEPDHSGRTNFIAHHLVLSAHEVAGLPAGPVTLATQPGLFQRSWQEPAKLLPIRELPPATEPGGAGTAWRAAGLDQAWAAWLAQRIRAGGKTTFLIHRLGFDLLPLFRDVFALLPPAQRWTSTFATYSSQVFPGVGHACALRGVVQDTSFATTVLARSRADCVDLTNPGPAPRVAAGVARRPAASGPRPAAKQRRPAPARVGTKPDPADDSPNPLEADDWASPTAPIFDSDSPARTRAPQAFGQGGLSLSLAIGSLLTVIVIAGVVAWQFWPPQPEVKVARNDNQNGGSQPSQPPATQPPATQPPATQPPATQPPATQPPATQPPATQPPATQPPATQPPATQPPATQPPATQPPATQPPATQPPATQPPATQPSATPPAEQIRTALAESQTHTAKVKLHSFSKTTEKPPRLTIKPKGLGFERDTPRWIIERTSEENNGGYFRATIEIVGEDKSDLQLSFDPHNEQAALLRFLTLEVVGEVAPIPLGSPVEDKLQITKSGDEGYLLFPEGSDATIEFSSTIRAAMLAASDTEKVSFTVEQVTEESPEFRVHKPPKDTKDHYGRILKGQNDPTTCVMEFDQSEFQAFAVVRLLHKPAEDYPDVLLKPLTYWAMPHEDPTSLREWRPGPGRGWERGQQATRSDREDGVDESAGTSGSDVAREATWLDNAEKFLQELQQDLSATIPTQPVTVTVRFTPSIGGRKQPSDPVEFVVVKPPQQ